MIMKKQKIVQMILNIVNCLCDILLLSFSYRGPPAEDDFGYLCKYVFAEISDILAKSFVLD